MRKVSIHTSKMRTPITLWPSAFLLLFCIFITDVQSQCATPVCYKAYPRDFAYNPGTYQPATLTINICKGECGKHGMAYAALTAGKYCFCGQSKPAAAQIEADVTKCQTPCAGNAAEHCGGPRHIYLHCATVPPVDTQVIPGTFTPEILTATKVNVTTLTTNPGYAYALDFGEGNGWETVASTSVEKTFLQPGLRTIKAKVSDSQGIAPSNEGAVEVVVLAPVEEIDLQCPPVWVTTLELSCNTTAHSGTLMRADIDYKDSKPHDNFPIADARMSVAGTGLAVTSAVAADANKVHVRFSSDFQEAGTLLAFEYFAAATGTANFLILRPSCGGLTYCHSTNDCKASCTTDTEATCSGTDVFCPYKVKCTPSTLPTGTCSAPAATRHPAANTVANLQYKVFKKFPHTISAAGRGQLKFNTTTTQVQILPGDVVGYVAAAGVIGQSTDGPKDYVVTGITDANEGDDILASNLNPSAYRVQLVAVASKPTVVKFYHIYDTAGLYKPVVNISNDLIPGKFLIATTELVIEEGINITEIIPVKYGITGQNTTFNLKPHTGSNLTYVWVVYKDGAVYLNVTTRTPQLIHAFTGRGVYNVTVRAYNKLVSKENHTLINNENKIDKPRLYGTHAATGKPYPATFNMTSGSDYNCTWKWGDGTTEEFDWIALPPTGSIRNHNFPAEGWYKVEVTCKNNVSTATTFKNVLSIDPPVNITLKKTGAIVGTCPFIEWKIDKGTNTTWVLLFETPSGNTTKATTFSEANKDGKTNACINGLIVARYYVYLRVSNPVENRTEKFTFTVDSPITKLQHSLNQVEGKVNGTPPFLFTTDMEGGSSVIVTTSCSDGTAPQVHDTTNGGNLLADWKAATFPAGRTLPLVQSHTFTKPGTFNCTTSVKNNFNSSVYNHSIDVYNKVEGLNLTSGTPLAFLGDKVDVKLWHTIATYPPTKGFVNWSFGGTIPPRNAVPFSVAGIKQTFDKTGKYYITSFVFNKVDNGWFNTTIHILRPVVSLEVVYDPSHPIVNPTTPPQIKIAMESGDDVTLYYKCIGPGGTCSGQTTRQQKSPYKWDIFSIATTESCVKTVGVYTCTVIASNALGNTSKNYEMHVENPVTSSSFVLTSTAPLEYTGTPVTATITLTAPAGQVIPTDAKYAIDYGDSVIDVYPPLQDLNMPPSRTLTFTHSYPKPGDYIVNVTVVNRASSQTFTVPSGVFERISGVTTLALQQQVIPNGQPPIPLYGTNKDTLAGHNILSLQASVTKGTVKLFTVTTEVNGVTTTHTSATQPILIKLDQEGDYKVTTLVSNPINSESSVLNFKVQKAVRGVSVTTNGALVKPGVEATLSVSAAEVGQDSCLSVNYGEPGGTVLYYGTATGCAGVIPAGLSISGTISNAMALKHTFKTAGTYNVELKASTPSLQATNTSKISVTVSNTDCHPPIIKKVNPSAPLFYEPAPFESSDYIKLEATNEINCKATLTNTKRWKVFSINDQTGADVTELDLSKSNVITTNAALVIGPGAVPTGSYRANFRMAMQAGGQEFASEKDTFFKSVLPSMRGSLVEGFMSSITVGANETFTLSARKYSTDPSLHPSQPQGLSFECFCRRLDETFSKYKNGSLVKTNPSKFMTYTEQQGYTAIDNGGCARKGPGYVMPPDPGDFTVHAGNMRVNESYEFVCTVSKGSRETTAKLTVHVVEGKPPRIVVKCSGTNEAVCSLRHGMPGMAGTQRINPNFRVAMVAFCSPVCCGGSPPIYKWSLERRRINGEWVETDMTAYVQGTTSPQIAMPSALFMAHLTKLLQYMDYRVKVEVRCSAKDTPGMSSAILNMNLPPTPGTCTLDKTAYNLGDKSTLTTLGWVDDDGIEEVNLVGVVGDTSIQLTYADEARTMVVLPLGDPKNGNKVQMKCLVKDKYGAVTTHNMTDVTVSMDSAKEQEIITSLVAVAQGKDLALKKAAEEGDSKTILALIAELSAKTAAVSSSKLKDLKAVWAAEEAKLQAQIKTGTLTDEQLRALIAKRDAAKKEYEELRDVIVQVKEKMITALMSLETDTPEGLIALAKTASNMDDSSKMTLVLRENMLAKGVQIAEGLKKNGQNLTRETIEDIFKAGFTYIMTALHSTAEISNSPTLTELRLSKLSDDYFYDADYAALQEDFGNDKYAFQKSVVGVDAIQQAQKTLITAFGALDGLIQVVTDTHVAGENQTYITIGGSGGSRKTTASVKKRSLSELTSGMITQDDVTINLPKSLVIPKTFPDNSTEDPILGLALVTMSDNPFLTGEPSAVSVDLSIVDIRLSHENGTEREFKNLTTPVDLYFKAPPPDFTLSKPALPPYKEGGMRRHFWYHSVDCLQYEALQLRIAPDPQGTTYLIMAAIGDFPNCTMDANCTALDWVVLPKNKTANGTNTTEAAYMTHLSNHVLSNKAARVILGVRELHGDELTAYQKDPTKVPKFTNPQDKIFTKTYNASFSCLGIFFLDPKNIGLGWHATPDMTAVPSKLNTTQGQTRHLSLFGGGFAVKPNKIDWAFVFSNMDFFKNPTLYIVEIIILIIFVIAVIWARYKDKKDKLKLGVTPLPDNEADDKCLYEIVVYTGMRPKGGTESKVNFIISGERDETDVRTFGDPERKIFKRGAVDAFLLATPHSLGALNYMRLWHDNSGKGKYGSWYLKYVIVTDLQSMKKYFFICNRWLAVEEDDGMVDRLLAVAGKEQMTEFSHMFSHSTKKKLDDDHLWFSVVARPPQSRFTRVQRVSCCLLLLYTTMLADAVFYGVADSNSGKKVFSLGPFALTPQQLYVGIIANLIVFPINFLVTFLFRKSRPRRKRPSRIVEAVRYMQDQKKEKADAEQMDAEGQFDEHDEPKDPEASPISSISRPSTSQSYHSATSIPVDPEPVQQEEAQEVEIPEDGEKKKFSLPWWCTIIAWIILILGVALSAAFVTFYGIMFQDEKAKKWLTSMLVSFFTSVFFTQPIQVLLVAALLSLIFKNPNLADDDGEDDEEELELGNDETYLHQMPQEGYARPRKIAYRPPDPAALEKARQQRMQERQMYAVMREILFYFIFLWMLLVISYSFRDPNAFFIKESFHRHFIDRRGIAHDAVDEVKFTDIKKMTHFFEWANTMLLPMLRADRWYNGDWLPGQRGFINDRNNRLMGFATIRQLRVHPAKCNLVKPMDKVLNECNVPYAFYHEDKRNRGIGWVDLQLNGTWNNTDEEYNYRSATDLESYPYWAKHHVYSGGGYVRELRGSSRVLKDHFKKLHDGGWFDRYTRAVFIEFTVYNAQVNIFTICTLAVEFLPTGALFPSYRIEPVNLLGYSMDTAGFEIICQIVYMIYIIFFIVGEGRELYKKRKAYFASYWNWVEMMIIFLSLAGAVIFFYRLIMANRLTARFKETHGNAYMKFQYVGYWNELLLYMMGWLVFLATIKFLRLLRFNKRMSMLASTLKNCAGSLMNFALMFVVVFFAYVQFFYLLFFITISEFSTFLVASETCLQMILGRFNFFEMKGANPTLGPLFFLAYVISVALILINMFVTILNESFSAVRDDLTKQMNDYEIVEFIMKRLKTWTGVGAVVKADKSQEEQDEYAIQMAKLDAMAKVGQDGYNPTFQQGAEMEDFPDKVDRLVRYIGNMYFPNKEWLEAIAIKKMEEKRKSHDRGPDYDRF